ncbi:protein translocase subunit SecD [Candidatus Falkowbacteria bacterium CG10_big_fil_rev_8_21_14_0_10_39_11]|uniref:Protein translocase subunit SecD n=1 Tax=Candidatus Falkowbacteria bacterium CG10_big_fil_rev_8_21_14_0_10_39_11 TaxID=1974565 RepID=A0A2H0V4S1_9BACT|nr:MAG: protein translocase subunit SecD [Candidatus Falkowbacteria bacterium CG10_big_fil_rev_8_21_14_0_10_39_11]
MAKMKEKTRVRLWLVLIIVVALFFGVYDYPPILNKGIEGFNKTFHTSISTVSSRPFTLGLDLQGGTHLVYEADTSDIDSGEEGSAVEGVRDVIERRVNSLGVAEPIVQTNQVGDKWRVIVELAGIKDVNEAINAIGETPLLEFKEESDTPARTLTAEEKNDLLIFNKNAEALANLVLDNAVAGGDFSELAAGNSDDLLTKDKGGRIGILTGNEPEYEAIYELITSQKITEPTVLKKLLDDGNGYNIVNVNEIKAGDEQVKASHLLICYNGATGCTDGPSKEEAEAKIRELKALATPDNFSDLVKEHSSEPGASVNAGDLGWFGRGVMVSDFEDAVFNMETGQISDVIETEFGFHLIFKEGVRQGQNYDVSRIFIDTKTEADILPPIDKWKNTELSGKHLDRAWVAFDQTSGAPQVSLQFNEEGDRLFGEVTERNIGKPVAIYLDGVAISIPVVNEKITGGEAVITGSFDLVEARLLSQRLNAGALPVPIELVSQQTVGATLGHESLTKSLFAALIGLLLVALFMIVYYRLPGIMAVIVLLIYTSILLFLFKLIPVTLTLAGIAGFILSIGMAVDANVLIFERLKEELKTGKPLGSAVDEGFKRAWPSIRDGNASTLITCFILAWFGTSMIKGFAITLGVGIMVSMFSAIVVTSYLLKQFMGMKDSKKNLFWFGINKK